MKQLTSLTIILFLLASCGQKKQSAVIKGSLYTVEFDNEFPMNELFEFTFNISPTSEKVSIKVDATMPSHGHGMTTETKIEKVSSGVYKVRGMQLHMTGEWVLTFEVFEGGKLKEKLEHKLTL